MHEKKLTNSFSHPLLSIELGWGDGVGVEGGGDGVGDRVEGGGMGWGIR